MNLLALLRLKDDPRIVEAMEAVGVTREAMADRVITRAEAQRIGYEIVDAVVAVLPDEIRLDG